MTREEQMVQKAEALAPQLIAATHAERVGLFRALAESCAWSPEIWAVGAAIVVQVAPAAANRTSLIAAALEAAFELGVARGAKASTEMAAPNGQN